MVSIARKNLFHEKGRLVISVGGVAFSTMLIMILIGVYYGIFTESTCQNKGRPVGWAGGYTRHLAHVLPSAKRPG